jgi:hypothetical protein
MTEDCKRGTTCVGAFCHQICDTRQRTCPAGQFCRLLATHEFVGYCTH